MDVDIDLAPSKLQKIFSAIREERGELGIVQVCTFGTEGTKSAILTACRGYRSEEYPNGIDNDEAQYISSLVPSERGFLWTLKDLIEGNPEKDRKTLVDDRMKTYDLQNMFEQYEERNATIDKITGLLSGTDYEKSIPSIIDVVLVADTMKQLYLNLLKKLGRASGIEVYRRLKVAYNK